MKTVHYTTEDKRTLKADVYKVKGDRWAILLHMMPATKGSYQDLATALNEKGISCIAFDQRGHGESQGGPGGFKEFTDFEQQAKMKDVEATVQFLLDDEVSEKNILMVGASIGANLAMLYAVSNAEIPAVVALSPGLDYRGVVVEEALYKLETKQDFLIVASEEDDYAALSSRRIFHTNEEVSELIMKKGIGHGTDMLEADEALFTAVVDWIDTHV